MDCSHMGRRLAAALFAALIFLLAAAPRPAAAAGKTETGSSVIVSLGDSFSSGEGVEAFYGQDADIRTKAKDQDWLAHRSQNSWSGMLTLPGVGKMADHRNEDWYFMACSGAITKNIAVNHDPLPGGDVSEKDADKLGYQRKDVKWDTYGTVGYVEPQLNVFDRLDRAGKRADYVTITIGGNDAHFTEVVTMAALSGMTSVSVYLMPNAVYCVLKAQMGLIWGQFYLSIRGDLKDTYRAIARAAGGQATILVAGYPELFEIGDYIEGDTLSVTVGGAIISKNIFTLKEKIYVNKNVYRFNRELKRVVSECEKEGLNIRFVPVDTYFRKRSAQIQKPLMNGIIQGSLPEDLDKTAFISHYSMHPNLEGCRAYAECVQKAIEELEPQKQKERALRLDAGWGNAYRAFIENKKYLSAAGAAIREEDEPSFSLYDIDRDGIPELLVYGVQRYESCVFSLKDEKVYYAGKTVSYIDDDAEYAQIDGMAFYYRVFYFGGSYPGLFWYQYNWGDADPAVYWIDYYYMDASGKIKSDAVEAYAPWENWMERGLYSRSEEGCINYRTRDDSLYRFTQDMRKYITMYAYSQELKKYTAQEFRQMEQDWLVMNHRIQPQDLWGAIDRSGVCDYIGMTYARIKEEGEELAAVFVLLDEPLSHACQFSDLPDVAFSFEMDYTNMEVIYEYDALDWIPGEIVESYFKGTERCDGAYACLSTLGFTGVTHARDIGAEVSEFMPDSDVWWAYAEHNGLEFYFSCRDREGTITGDSSCWIVSR